MARTKLLIRNCVHINLDRWLYSPKQKWRLQFNPKISLSLLKLFIIVLLYNNETPFIIVVMPERVAYDLLVDLCILLPSNEMKEVRTSMAHSFLVG